ncbi:GDP-D-glucose phosphorylase 1 [Drosophila bipectinata]|uniref:GDP-D-glucose phosphorylase 1 n=1 Tax=Drosophila bipectinata TaxID=42026 RepID=UPI001C8A7023|nr:GDP-D-glucose phosphorylase 1 [Drosophila bipectinata]
MFASFFRPLLRSHRQIWVALSVHLRRFMSAGFINRYCLRKVATLMPVAIIRTANCYPNEPNGPGEKRRTRKRSMSRVKFDMSLEGKAQQYLDDLKARWMELHKVPGLFSYQLQKTPRVRQIPGPSGFYTELNTDRSRKRRQPQTIENLNPTFKPKMFNFNKVDPMEVLLKIDDAEGSPEVQMIINKSPITKYHTLICPEVEKNHVQRLNREVLHFSITFMRNIDDQFMRIGYNSPGALASVNHLHFHLLEMPYSLYVDRVPLEKLAGNYIYRLSRRAPTEGICFVFGNEDSDEVVDEKVSKLYELAMWMCRCNMPHNLFITQDLRPGKKGDVLVFVFPRSEYCVSKDLADFNVGFCELAGYIPLPDPDRMNNITEQEVLLRIRTVTGDAPKDAYKQMIKIIEGREEELWDNPFTM